MSEKQICTAEEKHKKASDYGEWVYIQKMKFFHAKFGHEYQDNRDYFSNLALHDSYKEEIIAEQLHKRCAGQQECLINKRKIETYRTMNDEKPKETSQKETTQKKR